MISIVQNVCTEQYLDLKVHVPISNHVLSLQVDFADGTMVITPHAKFGFILLLILLIALVIFIAVRFRLNKWIGISFVLIYVLFLVYAFTQELFCVRSLGMYC